MCAHAKLIAFGRFEGIGCMPMQNLLLLAELEGIGCVPMQNLLLFAEPEALGVCPCKIYCFWAPGRHWASAHAESMTFRRTEGIGCVPMQNLLLLTEPNTLGALCAQGLAWGPGCVVDPVAAHAMWRGQRQCREGGERFRGVLHRVLHLLRYCATLARPGP